MDPLLVSTLAVIKTVSAVTWLKVKTKLELLSRQEQASVVEMLRQVDALAYFWQSSWKEVARAWLLMQISTCWISVMGYTPPHNAKTDLGQWLGQLRVASEQKVRSELANLATGRRTLMQISQLQQGSARQAWGPGSFTDPRKHNDGNFCYIIHAMRSSAGLGTPAKDTKPMFEHLDRNLGKYILKGQDKSWTLKSAELYLDKPSLICAEMLSCSVISNKHVKLYGNFTFGFILTVPAANVCIASTTDLAISNAKARACVLSLQPTPLHRLLQVDDFIDSLLGLYSQKLDSPQQILAASGSGHNEVVVLGFAGNALVEVSGIFVKVTPKGMLWKSFAGLDDGLLGKILKCARENNLPIIPIKDPAGEGSSIPFDIWVKGKSASKQALQRSPIEYGNRWATERTPDRTREYDLQAITGDAKQWLHKGKSAEQVHRKLHDEGGVPHEVIERVLNQLGHRNYL